MSNTASSRSEFDTVAKIYVGNFVTAQWARIRAQIEALDGASTDGFVDIRQAVIQVFVRDRAKEKVYVRDGITVRAVSSRSRLKVVRPVREQVQSLGATVLHCHGFVSALIGVFAKGFFNKKVLLVYEVHGAVAYESWYRHSGSISRIPRFLALYFLESLAAILCDRMLLVSEEIIKYYPAYRLRPHESITRALMARQEVVSGRSHIPYELKELVASARKDNRIVMAYAGSAFEWQRPVETVALMKNMVEARVAKGMILTAEPAAFLTHIGPYDSNDWFVGSVETGSVMECLGQADAGVLLREDIALNRVSSPTKLYEYLAAGLMVITTSGVKDALPYIQSGDAIELDMDSIEAREFNVQWLAGRLRSTVRSKGRPCIDIDVERGRGATVMCRLYGLEGFGD